MFGLSQRNAANPRGELAPDLLLQPAEILLDVGFEILRERGVDLLAQGGQDDVAFGLPFAAGELADKTVDLGIVDLEGDGERKCTLRAVIVPPVVVDSRYVGEVRVPVDLAYRVALPEGYDGTKKWPLVLFLHGSGERGSDLNLASVHGPLKEIAAGRPIPAIVVVPQLPAAERGWNARGLLAMLDAVQKKYRVDPDAVSVTGLSMGGFGTWNLVSAAPKRFAAVAPICGGTVGVPLPADLKGLPVWAVHGTADGAVAFEQGLAAAVAAKAAGADLRFDRIEGGGHDVWTQTYAKDEFWRWIVSARRKSPSSPPRG